MTKPSGRIAKIYFKLREKGEDNSATTETRAIIQYLDEEHEKNTGSQRLFKENPR